MANFAVIFDSMQNKNKSSGSWE